MKLAYEDIDLFYYHAIDVDFSRLSSILDNGILSANACVDKQIKGYYRNFTHASCKNDFISVSHFPRTIMRYYKIENELFDSAVNKIIFVLNGEIDALDKQHCKNRYKYTNERHVHYEILPENIEGILIRDIDAQKKIKEIGFDTSLTDKKFFIQKLIIIINFFKDRFGFFKNDYNIYYLIGKLEETNYLGLKSDDLIKTIGNNMKNSINETLEIILNRKEPTLLEVIAFINQERYPIYLMNRFDIKLLGEKLSDKDSRLDAINSIDKVKLKELEKQVKLEQKYLKDMTSYGVDIYFNYVSGPLTKEDIEIVKKLKR